MNQIEELKNTFIEEFSSAKILKDMNKLKSAVILLSKSLFALCDYIIFKKYNKLPKNHKERFLFLEIKEKAIFEKVSLIWSQYTDTYSQSSHSDSYDKIHKEILDIIKNEKLDSEIKAIIEK